MTFVTGDVQIDRKLRELKQSAQNKIARPALTKAARLSAKAMKSEVPANLKDAKRAIGYKVKVKGTEEIVAKAGAGVGIKRSKLTKQLEKQKVRRAGHPGVGISAANIHWFLLGTEERVTKEGHKTGRMPPQMQAIKAGYQKSESQAIAAMKDMAKLKLAQIVK